MKKGILLLLWSFITIPCLSQQVLTTKNGKYGLADIMTGKILAPCIYDELDITDGTVSKDNLHGAINMANGKEIVPCIYAQVSYMDNGDYYSAEKKDGSEVLFDSDGKVISSPPDGNIKVYVPEQCEFPREVSKEGDFQGVWDKNLKQWIIPPKYQKIEQYLNNDNKKEWYLLSGSTQQPWGALEPYVVNLEKAKDNGFKVTKVDKFGNPVPQPSQPVIYYGVADSTGRIVISVACYKILITWNTGNQSINDYFQVQPTENSKWGVVNAHTGCPTIPFIYDWFQDSYGEYFVKPSTFGKKGVLLGLIDIRTGQVILPIEYDRIIGNDLRPFTHDIHCYDKGIPVERDGKWGIMDTTGNTVLPCIYDDINRIENHDGVYRFVATLAGLKGLYDASGKDLLPVPVQYKEIYLKNYEEEQNEKYYIVVTTKNEHSTLLDFETLSPVESFTIANEIYPVSDTPRIVANEDDEGNNHYGVVDGHGKPLTSFDYDEIDFTDKHTARMYKWGDDQSANVSMYDLQTGITTTIPVRLVFGLRIEDRRNSDLSDYMGFEQNGKYGCYSLKEKKITVPAKYDELQFDTSTFRAIVKKNDHYGMIDMVTGQTIIPFEYDELLFVDYSLP